MPVITDISRQKKNDAFYNIFVDGNFSCGIGALELSGLGLKVGQELSESDLSDIVANSLGSKAYNAALRYLSYRPRSKYEVEAYLTGKENSAEVTSATISRLEDVGLVNDEDFARSWVRSRQATKPRARRVLASELMLKRVPRDVIDSVLADSVDDSDELLALSSVATKKLRLPRYHSDKQKLTQYLVGQGYKYSDVAKVLSDLMAEDNKS